MPKTTILPLPNKYQAYMEKHDEAIARAKEALDAGDIDMVLFWKSAALGFKIKALNLMVGE